MGAVEANALKYWCDKVGNDPEMLAEDESGKKIPLDATPRPKTSRTFCNISVQRICRGLGYNELENKMANQIFDYCSDRWFSCNEIEARDAACIGDLVLAAWKNPEGGHGHVAVVYPERLMVYSGKWQRDCPMVAAVDKPIPIGANYSFRELPRYFRLGRVTN